MTPLIRHVQASDLPLRQLYVSEKLSEAELSKQLPKLHTSGSLRVPGGAAPVQPGDDRSPFRFFNSAPESPPTPIDSTPITPDTPRLPAEEEEQPVFLSSMLTAPFEGVGTFPAQEPKLSFKKRFDAVNSISGRSQSLDDTFVTAHVNRHKTQPSYSMLPKTSREQRRGDNTTPISPDDGQCRTLPVLGRHPVQHDSDLSHGVPQSDHSSSVDRTIAGGNVQAQSHAAEPWRKATHNEPLQLPAAIEGNTLPADRSAFPKSHAAQHGREHSASSLRSNNSVKHARHPTEDSNDLEIAAAQAAVKANNMTRKAQQSHITLERPWQDHIVLDISHQPSTVSSHRRDQSNPSQQDHHNSPIASPNTCPDVTEAPQTKITPTPNPPSILRLSSKLKNEVKGVFTWKSERSEQITIAHRKEYTKRVDTKHWTDLDY